MNIKDYKIVFLGTPDISAKLLKGLVDFGFNIPLVITQPDKKTGRNQKLEESEVSKMCKVLSLNVFKPVKLNRDYQVLLDINPDLLLTFAYGQILSTSVLNISKYKPLNLHASLLPKYRGASPIQTALLNGDKKTGITLMEMEKGMDTGKIYYQEQLDILLDDNYTSLKDRLTTLAIDVACNKLPLFFEDKLNPILQDDDKASYTTLIKKEDEHLSFDDNCFKFINKVRALSFTPGAFLNISDNEIIKIYQASFISNEKLTDVGSLIKYQKKLALQLSDGLISLDLLQKSGKKMTRGIDFLNGIKDINSFKLY